MRLIVNADDFGYTPGVTAGIVRAHREGIVTATTLMVNAPDTKGAVAAASRERRLDVGVHLVLTYGRPLTDPARVPSLVRDDGTFFEVGELMRAAHPRSEEALTEYRAQYARATHLLGRAPTHIDTHHWVHDLPPLEDAVFALAKETGAAVRTHDGRQRARFRDAGIRTPDRFVREFQHGGAIHVEALLDLLERLVEEDDVVELMCHPAEVDDALLEGSRYARERGTELETLTDADVRAAIARLGIELTTFAELSS